MTDIIRQRARDGYVERNLTILDQHSRRLHRHMHRKPASAGYSRLPDTYPEESGIGGMEEKLHPQIRLVHLNGYVCEYSQLCVRGRFSNQLSVFGVIPSVEAQLTAQVKSKDVSQETNVHQQYIIVDMHSVNRLETAAARIIRTKSRDEPGLTLVLCGFSEASGTAADLTRSGLDLSFASADGALSSTNEECIHVFDEFATALMWCKSDIARREDSPLSETAFAKGKLGIILSILVDLNLTESYRFASQKIY